MILDSIHTARLLVAAARRAGTLLSLTAVEMRGLGDVVGHEFHGNQWTGGQSGPVEGTPGGPNEGTGSKFSRKGGALWSYRTSGGADDLNSDLRAGTLDKNGQKMRFALDAEMRPIAETTTVYRFVPEEVTKSLVMGSGYTDKGFVSTSKTPELAAKYDMKPIEIEVPKGAPAIQMSHYYAQDPEKEIILPHGSHFEVISTDPPKMRMVGFRNYKL